MNKTYILYNPLAGDAEALAEKMKTLREMLSDKSPICTDATSIESYEAFFAQMDEKDTVYLCGGDGTINQLINRLSDPSTLRCRLFYYGTGSGNDFLRDLNKNPGCDPFPINSYLTQLPTVTVNGKQYRFLNNVGYGIDGYCTEEGDRLKQKSKKAVNYTAVAIRGLLFHFHPVNATVTVDGKEYRYRRVWLAPTMNGRFYGGGMMPTPSQNRLDPEGRLSLMLIHGVGKLRTLVVFPSIFTGQHIKHEDMVAIHTGTSITVEFDRPTPLQIDGETIPNVCKYHAERAVCKREATEDRVGSVCVK